jgi:acyl homoserine lactone synthase
MDRFDSQPRAAYILAKSPAEGVVACWRLLPTTGPNMLADCFPELLHGQAAPAAEDTWELSRFAVATNRLTASNGSTGVDGGFGALSMTFMSEAFKYARQRGIVRCVTVTTTSIERMLKRQGINIHRIGPPIRIGIAMTVACFIELDAITDGALGM